MSRSMNGDLILLPVLQTGVLKSGQIQKTWLKIDLVTTWYDVLENDKTMLPDSHGLDEFSPGPWKATHPVSHLQYLFRL